MQGRHARHGRRAGTSDLRYWHDHIGRSYRTVSTRLCGPLRMSLQHSPTPRLVPAVQRRYWSLKLLVGEAVVRAAPEHSACRSCGAAPLALLAHLPLEEVALPELRVAPAVPQSFRGVVASTVPGLRASCTRSP